MQQPLPVRAWLWTCVTLCASMVVVGGITRLTGSGLSITEWRPITGALPPLTHADWERLFALYRASPQYQLVNSHFALADFQQIFWWEWIHRQLGRVVGLTYLVPLLVFAARRALPPWLVRRGAWLFGMVCFQGLLGWLMVKSGLSNEPRVSHFRLAAHLLTALATFSVTLWTSLEAGRSQVSPRATEARPVWLALALLTLQIAFGAFMAGLKAGFLFDTFPKMGDVWISPLVGTQPPFLHDLLNNLATVQLVHRWLAVAVVAALLVASWRAGRAVELRGPAGLVALVALGQFALGVITILGLREHPVLLGTLHQAGSVALLAVTIRLAFRVAARASLDGDCTATPAPAAAR